MPIARTGEQEYIGTEIGLDTAAIVPVMRDSTEVFSEAALASFEGKPVTDDHPPELLTPDTATMYEKGHAQNVRKGIGEWDEFILADLHIHDRDLIEKIQGGKREVSCGYECEYAQDADGKYHQKNIRGNHIAIVEKGRAGSRAAIMDTNQNLKAGKPPERKKMKKNGLFLKLFGQAANGKTPEEIAQMAMDAADALEGEETPAADKEPYKEKLYEPIDDTALDGLVEKIMAKMAAKKAMEEAEEDPEIDADPLKTTIEKLTGGEAEVQPGGGSEDGNARVVPAEEMDKTGCGMDKALAASILKAMRPTIASIKNEKERLAVSDALIKCVTTNDGASDIAKILQAAQNNARKAADAKPEMNLDEIQKLYDSRNPHKNGGMK